jgi:hypothetical protein
MELPFAAVGELPRATLGIRLSVYVAHLLPHVVGTLLITAGIVSRGVSRRSTGYLKQV